MKISCHWFSGVASRKGPAMAGRRMDEVSRPHGLVATARSE